VSERREGKGGREVKRMTERVVRFHSTEKFWDFVRYCKDNLCQACGVVAKPSELTVKITLVDGCGRK